MNTSKRINNAAFNRYILIGFIVVLILYLYVFFHNNLPESSSSDNYNLPDQQNTSANIDLALCGISSSESSQFFKYKEPSSHPSQHKQEISPMDGTDNKISENSTSKSNEDAKTQVDFHEKRLSLEECKKIVNQDGYNYTDEEIIIMRDWLYHFADMTLEDSEKEKNNS